MSEVNKGPIKSPTLEQFAEMLLESVRSGRELQWAEETADYFEKMDGDHIAAGFDGDVELTKWTIRLKPITTYYRVSESRGHLLVSRNHRPYQPWVESDLSKHIHDFEIEQ